MDDTHSVVVSTLFTEHHQRISQLMLEQIVAKITLAMREKRLDVGTYQVTDESWERNESIKVKLDDKTSVRISVSYSK
jgi:hypothetical protein